MAPLIFAPPATVKPVVVLDVASRFSDRPVNVTAPPTERVPGPTTRVSEEVFVIAELIVALEFIVMVGLASVIVPPARV